MKLTTPIAVLVGVCVVGLMLSVAVYLGLRGSRPVAAPLTSSVSSSTPAASSSTTISPPPSSAPTVDVGGVKAEVAAALEQQRPALLAKCWQPSVAKAPAGPDHVAYTLNFNFGPDGHQITRGIVDGTAGAGRGDVAACVSTTLTPVAIRARGSNVYVEVPLRLP